MEIQRNIRRVIPDSCEIRTGLKNARSWTLDNKPYRDLVHGAGFGWCSQLKKMDADLKLISALIYLYDAGTSTFVINDQHYMISLEDIIYLTGLNVDGLPVSPKDVDSDQLCLELLGEIPPRVTLKGVRYPGYIKLDWLKERFIDVEENASEYIKQRHARAHILYMIGSVILPSTVSGHVLAIYLDLLRDFEQIKSYSWGSALLALMLHSLNKIKPNTSKPVLGGCAILLQLWAFELFKKIRPSGEGVVEVERAVPLLKYWTFCYGRKSLDTTHKKSSREWVQILQSMDIESVDLNPYKDLTLSENLRSQLALKRSRTTVICIDRYSRLRPDVCHLQCGPVTNPLGDLPPQKKYKERKGKMDVDWYEHLSGPVDEWERRWNNLIAVKDSVERPFSIEDIPLSWPPNDTLTFDWIQVLMSAFDWSSKNISPSGFRSVLPVPVFHSLILSACKIFKNEANIVEVDDLGPDSSIVVVGDIHGQLHDFLFLLRDTGYPSENRVFVFNGDYVDRGAWGLETFMLLLAWKVFMPSQVYLLRGNHETKLCTTSYGFKKEVETKYGNGDEGKHAYDSCLSCFNLLPLASIIAGRVFTCHGGLFRSVPDKESKKSRGKKKHVNPNSKEHPLSLGSLEELKQANRRVFDPKGEGSNLIPGDVLWSDPSMSPGLSLNEGRGIGLLWGPDCTEDFLKKSDLKLIIRSHEGPDARKDRPGLSGMDNGYTIDHVGESGKLITLFSAPDYPQFQASEERYNNKGAYIVLGPPYFDTPEFHTFEAITPRPNVNAYVDSDEELDLKKASIGL